MSNNKIKVALFDIGGVLIRIHPEIFFNKFTLLKDIFEKHIKEIEQELELGYQPPKPIIHKFLKENNLVQLEDEVMQSYTLDYVGENIPEMEQLIPELAKNKKLILGILSNTNEIHFQTCWKQYPHFSYFQKFYLSFQLHLRKPDTKIFEYLIKDLAVEPEKILFIDDALINIQKAQALGINGLMVTKNNPEINLIKEKLI